jgi:hypothetical protein
MNPAALGYYERRTGSGIWYRPDRPTTGYEPCVCERLSCGREFMGRRERGRGRFCTKVCAGTAKRQPRAGYTARHERVYMDRGKATDQACADCGEPARHWSQIHGTDGTDPAHYEPRCVRCHSRYDHQEEARS